MCNPVVSKRNPVVEEAMRWDETAEQRCSIARALAVIGERWTLLVIREAFLGVRRFDGFHERLGIARNVLTQRLTRLVAEGVLEKVPYQECPIRHEYRLTERGRDLYPVLVGLMAWGDRWCPPADGPQRVLVHRDCGHVVEAATTCPDCGAPMDASNSGFVDLPR